MEAERRQGVGCAASREVIKSIYPRPWGLAAMALVPLGGQGGGGMLGRRRDGRLVGWWASRMVGWLVSW